MQVALARLRHVDNQRMELLREAIGTVCADPEEVEARALLAFCAAIGSHFLAADLLLNRPPGGPSARNSA